MEDYDHLRSCNSTKILKEIHLLLKDFTNVHSMYQPPCNEMKLAFTYEEHDFFSLLSKASFLAFSQNGLKQYLFNLNDGNSHVSSLMPVCTDFTWLLKRLWSVVL